jgi:hypothetical protein
MRTVIWLGLLYVGDAISNNFYFAGQYCDEVKTFFAYVFLCAMVMDISEWIKKMRTR